MLRASIETEVDDFQSPCALIWLPSTPAQATDHMLLSFKLIPLFAGAINLLLAVFVLLISPMRRLNGVFFLLGLSLAWWSFGVYLLAEARGPDQTLLRTRFLMFGVIFLPPVLYHFSLVITGAIDRGSKLRCAYLAAAAFAVSDTTAYFIERVSPHDFLYRAHAGIFFWIFVLLFCPVITIGTLSTLRNFINASPARPTQRAKLLFTAVCILIVGGFHDMSLFIWRVYPGTNIRTMPWGTLGLSFYGLLIGYSILSDQLFNIRLSISRHVATVLRLCFFAGFSYLLMLSAGMIFRDTFTGEGLIASLAALLLSAALTIAFFPKSFGKWGEQINNWVLGDYSGYRDKVTQFMGSQPESDNLQTLLDETCDFGRRHFGLSAIGIGMVINDPGMRGRTIRVDDGLAAWSNLIGSGSPLSTFFKATGEQLINTRDSFRNSSRHRAIRSVLQAESLELAFSIGTQDKEPVGFLVVGPKRNGRSLTGLDIELLGALCRNVARRVEQIAVTQNEELRQVNEAKDRFLACINHEIRNPLNGITGIAQMLVETNADPRSKYLLSTLQACTEQLRSSVDEVLDFTQIASDQVRLTESEVNLEELVRTTCSSCDIAGRNISVSKGGSADSVVQCDAGKIRQILFNYLSNALKYGEPKGATVELWIDSDEAKTRIRISVMSSGPTIGKEEMNGLFTALIRGRRARETNTHGTGLGLALCKKLAIAMGGSVGVESAAEKTTFWFEATFPTIRKISLPVDKPSFPHAGRSVLAIEDESYNRVVLEHLLKHFGISATWAENGETALALAEVQHFDAVIMDWLLPDMDGTELLSRLRSAREDQLPPVIVLSAYSTIGQRAECLAAGAVAFVSKPIDGGKLALALEACALGLLASARRSGSRRPDWPTGSRE